MKSFTCIVLLVVAAAAKNIEVTKRDDCSTKYGSETHSACIENEERDEEGVSDEDIQVILDLHNELRGTVDSYGQPPAADMMKMVWDDEIAMIAQNWASSCTPGHDKNSNRNIPDKYSVGQNWAGGQEDWTSAINEWFSEYKDFNYGEKGNLLGDIGHYTQIVWANSTRLGCGYALCADGTNYVCNYAPGGNYDISLNTPYKTGEKGSACPDAYNTDTGLCDCGGLACYYDGFVQLKTCRCDCTAYGNYPVLQPDSTGQCALHCDGAEDDQACGGFFSLEKCKEWANVPFECPNMCGTC